jgi:hypothetical protein
MKRVQADSGGVQRNRAIIVHSKLSAMAQRTITEGSGVVKFEPFHEDELMINVTEHCVGLARHLAQCFVAWGVDILRHT